LTGGETFATKLWENALNDYLLGKHVTDFSGNIMEGRTFHCKNTGKAHEK